MQFFINQDIPTSIGTIAVGVPDRLNRLGEIKYHKALIKERLEILEQYHVINSPIGKISSTLIYIDKKSKRLLTVRLGNLRILPYQRLLKAWGQLFQYLKDVHVTDYKLLLDTFKSKHDNIVEVCQTLGLQSAQPIFEFDHYKSDEKSPYQGRVYIQTTEYNTEMKTNEGQQPGESINYARELSQMPPNVLAPQYFAEEIRKHFEGSSVSVDIKDHRQIIGGGFGLIHVVGKSSNHGPGLITVSYYGAEADEPPISLVGRGTIYDPGGYSIKSKIGMQTMRYDMYDAANIIGMIDVISKRNLPVNIVGIITLTESMIGESFMKPDDVFTALNGETVEMLSSDAEGGMVLGDAVFYATQLKPQLILDFVTLTGAVIVALGDGKAVAFQSYAENELKDSLIVARHVDEKALKLSITETERHLIKQSDVADLANHMDGQGKALFAVAFVSYFSGDIPHIHFDIAGPAITRSATHKGPKGPTGYMVPTAVEWSRQKYK